MPFYTRKHNVGTVPDARAEMISTHTWPSKYSDYFTRAPAVVGNRDYIAQSAFVCLAHMLKHVDEAVGRAAAREDDYAAFFTD